MLALEFVNISHAIKMQIDWKDQTNDLVNLRPLTKGWYLNKLVPRREHFILACYAMAKWTGDSLWRCRCLFCFILQKAMTMQWEPLCKLVDCLLSEAFDSDIPKEEQIPLVFFSHFTEVIANVALSNYENHELFSMCSYSANCPEKSGCIYRGL